MTQHTDQLHDIANNIEHLRLPDGARLEVTIRANETESLNVWLPDSTKPDDITDTARLVQQIDGYKIDRAGSNTSWIAGNVAGIDATIFLPSSLAYVETLSAVANLPLEEK